MGMTKTTEAIIAELAEAYFTTTEPGRYARIAELAIRAGLTPEETAEAILVLMDEDRGFRAEPEPFGHRVTPADRQYGPVIADEARHLISWSE